MATYRDSGVDLDAADRLVTEIGPAVTATWGAEVVGGFGGFAAGVALPSGYDDPILMMSTDGVGTKAELARRTGLLDGLGWDLVAMCADDLVASGARPLAMTDYLAVGHLDSATVVRLIQSIAAACSAAGIALVGGETAEHPGVMDHDAFDIAGAALGVVERSKVIDGAGIRRGDVIIGLASRNLRSNGFSLVRHAILTRLDLTDPWPDSDRSVGEVLLEPSVVYTPVVLDLIATVPVRGLAHITGGGLAGNVGRVLPSGLDARIDVSTWNPDPVFSQIAYLGSIDEPEMWRTFNMGVGFVAVVPQDVAADAMAVAHGAGLDAWPIGEIVPGTGEVRIG